MEQIQQRVIKTATWTRICHTRSWELSLKTRSICWGNMKIETLFSVVHLWKDKKMSTNWNTENCLSTIVLLFCFTLKVVKNKRTDYPEVRSLHPWRHPHSPGHGPEHPAFTDPAWTRRLHWQAPGAPSNLIHPVILWHIGFKCLLLALHSNKQAAPKTKRAKKSKYAKGYAGQISLSKILPFSFFLFKHSMCTLRICLPSACDSSALACPSCPHNSGEY